MKKKIISVFLVTILMVGLLGSNVMAAEDVFQISVWTNGRYVQFDSLNLTSADEFFAEVWGVENGFYGWAHANGDDFCYGNNMLLGNYRYETYAVYEDGTVGRVLTGTFIISDTVTAVPNIAGRGTVSPSSVTGLTGESATFVAMPADGHFFKKWIDASGQSAGTELTLTVTINGSATYTAVFDTNPDTSDPYAPAEGTVPVEDDPIPAAIPNHIVQDLAEISPTAALYRDDDVVEDGTLDEPAVADEVPSMEEGGGDEDLDPMEEVAAEEVIEEDVMDQDVPADVPAMPETAGIPLALLALSGTAISGLGLKIRKRK